METVTVERTIPAPPAAVFDWLSNAHNYTKARMILRERLVEPGAEAPYGHGAVRILTWATGWFRERIVDYAPSRYFDYHVERSFPPAHHEHGRVSFTPISDGTRVVWTTTMAVRLPLLGGLVTRRVAKPILAHVFRRVLDAATAELRVGRPGASH